MRVEVVRESRLDEPGLELFGFAGDGEGRWRSEESWVSRCYGAREAANGLPFLNAAEGTQEFGPF